MNPSVGAASRQLTVHHATRRELVAAGSTLVVLDTGVPHGAGRPADDIGEHTTVIMVPGYTGAKEDFAPLLDPLADNGFRAVAVDLPGQFESAGPADEVGYGIDELGAVVHALVQLLPGPVVLLGHSFGGLVVRAAVLAGAQVQGLVLFSSGPAALPPGPRSTLITAAAPVLRARGTAFTWELQQQMLAANGGARDEAPTDLASYFRQRFVSSSPAGLLGMGSALLGERDRTDELAAVLERHNTPVLVVSGEADDAWGLDLQADMARRLGTALVPIPGAAHSAAVEAPDALLHVLLRQLKRWSADS
ncbi:alpha/beta fold hydrolase [Nakamurella sp. A5-74]|uniref:Alpha/beta fold hydrolase n=1 Tax=Nakamurella sp. A5-74 TaxID=3158264 RepID=A0AAU8DJM9_9ACTN